MRPLPASPSAKCRGRERRQEGRGAAPGPARNARDRRPGFARPARRRRDFAPPASRRVRRNSLGESREGLPKPGQPTKVPRPARAFVGRGRQKPETAESTGQRRSPRRRPNERKRVNTTRRQTLKLMTTGALAGVAPGLWATQARAANKRVAMVVKKLGNGFFDACRRRRPGGGEGTRAIELIYTGPTKATAEDQIAIIDALIAQNVNAIAISANDADALVPAARRRWSSGITVISFDSGVAAEDGRIMQLDAVASTPLIGAKCVQMMAKTLNIRRRRRHPLGHRPATTNQNVWIEAMKKEWAKPEYSKMKLSAQSMATIRPTRAIARPRSVQGLSEPQGHHRSDLGRHRRRRQGGGRRQPRRQGLRHRPWPAFRNEGRRACGRDATPSPSGTRLISATPPP